MRGINSDFGQSLKMPYTRFVFFILLPVGSQWKYFEQKEVIIRLKY